jgi:hypothetical protein
MASEKTDMDIVTGDVVEEQPDELKIAFDTLEEKNSNDPNDYKILLLNERMDDAAVKIKEQCIYKYGYISVTMTFKSRTFLSALHVIFLL